MSEIFSSAFGDTLKAYFYHFAIMFEALFILTTVDAGTRVGRFMLQDTLGNVWKPMARVSWRPGVWSTSAVVVGAWGYFLWTGVTNPLGGINQLFPLFGIANQLLAAVALAVCTTLLIKHDKLKYAWVTAIPLAWDTLVTLTASWQKIFSADPGLGFFAQRDRFQTALDKGTVLKPAKNIADMHAVVTNSTVDGVLSALFAGLIVIVLIDAVRVCIKAARTRGGLPTAETPYVESHIVAPAGLIPTAQERRVLAGTGAGSGSGTRGAHPSGLSAGPAPPCAASAGTCGRPPASRRTTPTSRTLAGSIPMRQCCRGGTSSGSARSPRCTRAKYVVTVVMTAISGTATMAPGMPAMMLPAVIPKTTASGCRCTARPSTSGCRMWPSSCCTASTTAAMISATAGPLATRATSTAAMPATVAPTSGMKAAKKVSSASGTTSGVPVSSRPSPMNTASTVATKIVPRM